MRHKEFVCIFLLLWSCSPVSETPEAQGPARQQLPPPAVAHPLGTETVPPKPHHGWIACGGRWTAGEGADIGAGFADQLGAGVVNAGITGEPLPGLLQRLPQLLGRQPDGLILEIGQEDEALNAPPKAFQKHLNALGQQLSEYPGLQLLIVVSAREAAYREPIVAFAKKQGAQLLSGDSLAYPPTAAQHDALAERVRQMLY
ncbi:MAG: hypothetical protein NXI25_13080 [bacterium]|nr:hypothetical protein [bacterium]